MLNNSNRPIILVTGGAGYVGSILCDRLVQERIRVICVDNLSFGSQSISHLLNHPDFKLIKTDIAQYESLKNIFEFHDIHAVVHLAAIVGDPACKLQPELAREVNGDASQHILDLCIQHKVSKLIFASTCSNYGMVKNNHFVNEDSPLSPVSLYAELKVEFEKILLEQIQKREEFSPTALRFATVYGLSPRMRFDLTVNEFTKELIVGNELVVFGEQFWRPYCHVADFSNAILCVLNAPRSKVAYNVFNVGDTDQNFTKGMIIKELLSQIPEAKIRFVHKNEDPRNYRVNFEKINKELGFKISKTVPEGITEIIQAIRAGKFANTEDPYHYNIPHEYQT